jgi:hypothetical protein
LNNAPDWTARCAAATKDWRNLDIGVPVGHHKAMYLTRPIRLTVTPTVFAGFANAGTFYLPAYPASVLVFDEGKAEIVDSDSASDGYTRVDSPVGRSQEDYVTTNDHNGIEVIDVATRRVINHFTLNTPAKQHRIFCGNAGSRGEAVLRRNQGNHHVSGAL